MLGLASTLAATTSDRRDDYKSLTGGDGNNREHSTTDVAGGSWSPPDIPYSKSANGIAFNTNYTTSSTFRGSYTISFWYKSADGRDVNRTNKYLASVGGGGSSLDYLYFALSSTGSIIMQGVSNSDQYLSFSMDQNLADGAIDWHHIAIVVTGGGGSDTDFKVYINGVAATMFNLLTVTSANHALFDADGGLHIAGTISNALSNEVSVASSIFNYDFIDDFCLHSSALDADNITAIYNSGTPINLLANSGDYDTSGDVVLYYRFNGEIGPNGTGLDSHGTSNGTGGQFSTESAS